MKKLIAVAAALALAGIGSTARAAESSGTLTVTGSIDSAISLTIESAGASTGGTGTASVTSALANRSRWTSAPSGFTVSRGASDWTLASSVGIKVEKANLTSEAYTLTAQLGSAPTSGITWKVNNVTLSDASSATLTATGVYDATTTLGWNIVIDNTAAPGPINNSIAFTATSN